MMLNIFIYFKILVCTYHDSTSIASVQPELNKTLNVVNLKLLKPL